MSRFALSRGYILLVAIIVSAIFIAVSTGLISYFTSAARSAAYNTASTQALAIAEGGVDDAAAQLNQNPNYAGGSGIALGNGTLTISVSSIDGSDKRITATSYVPNSSNPVSTKEVQATLSTSAAEASFHYGVQAGAGGFVLLGGAKVNGSVYANGNIQATNGVTITGSATAADPEATTSDQANATPVPITSCTSSTCITFGTTNATQDVAQSFQISAAEPLNSIQFYLKKVGTPSDATVRIVSDNGGVPSSNTLMSATLSASTVTTSFGWVTVTMPSTPVLQPAQTYWMIIDGSGGNASKYYVIGANAGGYANGAAMLGQYGSSFASTTPAGLDAYFQLYLGGGTSYIGGDTNVNGVSVGTTASDNAWAHTVAGATVTGTIYCQNETNTNKPCTTSNTDPAAAAFPLSDGDIQDFKSEASAGGVTNGDVTINSSGGTLGPQEIVGNLLVEGGGTLTETGTLWVTGSVTVTGGAKVKLASSYGSSDGVIVSDGYMIINGGSSFSGSGTSGSYPFLITTSACPVASGCSGNDAVYLSGGAGAVAVVAQNGTADIDGGSGLKAVTAEEIMMDGGATLTYDSGLISSNFSSGPGGSWIFVPGSYAIIR